MFKALVVLLFISHIFSAYAYDRVSGKLFASRSEVYGQNGMAATSHPLATQTAIDVLKKGGTAVDAAIAANAMLGLVEPTGAGIGGDLFAIVWDAKEKKLHGLNASGRSPQSLTLTELTKRGLTKIPSFGPLPVSVPGAVDGWYELHGKFGNLPMAELLTPSIHYAKNGFPVSEVVAHYWKLNAQRVGHYDGFADTYLIDGKVPKTGDIFKNPHLAATYEKLATGGRDAFYKGDIAARIAAHLKEQGGFLTKEDLASHTSEWVEPVSTNYRGYDIWELPPNGQGIAALQILNLLEGFDIRNMGFGSTEYIHTFIEAKKVAFADRAKFYADPAFNNLPVESLISKDYANERRALIDKKKAALSVNAGPVDGDTIYLTVADKDGNMVSLIQSNYRGMGSGMVPPELGFMLQNRGELFILDPSHYNTYAPGKRPFHTIIPAFVTQNGEPWMSFGVMGGATQPQMHAQILINMIDFDMNVQEAGDAPRVIHSGSSSPTGGMMISGGKVHIESQIPMQTKRELIDKGHKVEESIGVFGGYQAIRYDAERQVYIGASESRKDGYAAGY
ncbi:gamma-glutamyltransferase [Alteromonas sp. 5E99-2]|uniref:gamma-glutamyltransferase n=1 Tax=Alteromonas sp. 5E99-2 TaxID=2817683 RepID=UPI001A998065|nr:gamma-glutamyltransferase [Alteromonas sp. 5E99-2]MBO1254662.1 gamma-glutamyltransferase [Alteromonas sp. 5E99-2]